MASMKGTKLRIWFEDSVVLFLVVMLISITVSTVTLMIAVREEVGYLAWATIELNWAMFMTVPGIIGLASTALFLIGSILFIISMIFKMSR